VGCLLITLFLIERKIPPTPLLYLSTFFEATRRDYYDGRRAVSGRGAWADWLKYFLQGIAGMSGDAVHRAACAFLLDYLVCCGDGGRQLLLASFRLLIEIAEDGIVGFRRAGIAKIHVRNQIAQQGVQLHPINNCALA